MLDKKQKDLLKKIIPYAVEILLLAFAITLDLTMKDYLYGFLDGGTRDYVVIDGFLGLTYTENTGAGFGIFHGNTLPLTIITFVLITLITAYLAVGVALDFSGKKVRHDSIFKLSHWARVALVFIVGGGVGNLVDRFMVIDGSAYFGGVRDYFQFLFFDFPIFNIADAFVTVGAIWLVIYLIVMLIKDSAVESKKMKEQIAQAVSSAPVPPTATAQTAENATGAKPDAYASEYDENSQEKSDVKAVEPNEEVASELKNTEDSSQAHSKESDGEKK